MVRACPDRRGEAVPVRQTAHLCPERTGLQHMQDASTESHLHDLPNACGESTVQHLPESSDCSAGRPGAAEVPSNYCHASIARSEHHFRQADGSDDFGQP